MPSAHSITLRVRLVVLACCALLLAGGLLPAGAATSSAPVSHPEWGVIINPWEVDAATLDRRLDTLRAAGVTTVQSGAVWWWMCPAKGQCRYDAIDRLVSGAHKRGMSVSLQLVGAPDWIQTGSALSLPVDRRRWHMPSTSSELQEFAGFAGAVASRYRGRVSRYEVWNEPNTSEFSAPDVSPARYARLLAAGYTAVKANDPAARVVSGGLSRGDLPFLRQMLATLATLPGSARNGSYFDELGLHPYSSDLSPMASASAVAAQVPTGVDGSFGARVQVRQVLAQAGLGSKRLWLGEYGFSTTTTWMPAVPDSRRAAFLMMAFDLVRNDPGVSGLVWYSLSPDTSTSASWSLLDQDGRPTQTALAYVRAAAGPSRLSAGTAMTPRARTSTYSWSAADLGLGSRGVTRWEVLLNGRVASQGSGGTASIAAVLVAGRTPTVVFYRGDVPLGYL